MPHIITGEIRKEPFTREGNGNNGAWKMHVIELSERSKVRNKDSRQDEVVYTNYRFTFFANDAMRAWYDEAFQAGKVVSIQCDSLVIQSRESNGNVYHTLEGQRPQLVFSQKGGQQQSQQQSQQSGWGQPQQPQRQQQQQTNTPPMDFDDDIPF